MIKSFFLFFGIGCLTLSPAINITNDIAPEQLAAYLFDDCITINNVFYAGNELSGGIYQNATVESQGNTSLESGIVLSSGYVHYLNNNENMSNLSTGILELPGDADLQALVQPDEWGEIEPTIDASVLTIDFTASLTADVTVTLDYIFGSEEYEEFVLSDYNDVFGIFLDGVNIALLPGTETPISIHTINQYVNSGFYNPNIIDENGDSPFSTEMDGFTTPLRTAFTCAAGSVHTLKIGIADVRDDQYDSWVMVNGSSSCTPLSVPEPPTALLLITGMALLAGTTVHGAKKRS